MGTMNVGRVSMSDPEDIRIDSDDRRGITLRITGKIRESSLAATKAIRSELIDQRNKLIAFTYSEDSSHDGFYIQEDADVDALQRMASLQGVGHLSYDIRLQYVGSHASTVFRSGISGAVKSNDHGVAQGEAFAFHAAPVSGASRTDEYTGAGGNITAITRTTEDGDIDVFLDQGLADLVNPSWSCSPSTFYDGAVRIDVSEDGSTYYTRTGLNVPNEPAYFVLTNGLIGIRAEQSTGTPTGDISVRGYNSSWGSWIPFDIVWNSTTDIPGWDSFAVLRNDPECCIVRLRRDADDSPPSDKRHTLDITLRRGAPFAIFNYNYDTAVALTVDRASTDAGSSITPTGASSAMAITDAANDGDGNRWFLATSETCTIDTTNGGINMTGSQTDHQFAMGVVIDGSSAGSSDDADAMSLQYLLPLYEYVTARPR